MCVHIHVYIPCVYRYMRYTKAHTMCMLYVYIRSVYMSPGRDRRHGVAVTLTRRRGHQRAGARLAAPVAARPGGEVAAGAPQAPPHPSRRRSSGLEREWHRSRGKSGRTGVRPPPGRWPVSGRERWGGSGAFPTGCCVGGRVGL